MAASSSTALQSALAPKAYSRLERFIRRWQYAGFALLRTLWPNFQFGKWGAITRFADVQEALSRPDVFQVTYGEMMDPSVGPFMLGRDNTIFNQRDKGIMRALLSPEDLPQVRTHVRAILDGILDKHRSAGRLEIVENVTRQCPAMFNQSYFGFSDASLEQIKAWSLGTQWDMFHNVGRNEEIHQNNVRAGKEMHAMLSASLTKKRAALARGDKPRDVLDRLLQWHLPPETGFDDARILTNIMGLLVGSIETTSQAAAQIVNEFLRRPRWLAKAQECARGEDNELWLRYCWEALRFNPITPGMFRICAQDYTIARGTLRRRTFRKGTLVFILTASAMRDGRQLSWPTLFRVSRPDHHYMHMGYGLHTCLGDQISKVQVPEIVRAILLLPNLHRLSPLEYGSGDFPCRLEVGFG